MINKECVICGSIFETNDNYRGRKKQTCSVTCSRKLGQENSKCIKKCIVCNGDTIATKANKRPYCDECVKNKKKYSHTCIVCNNNFRSNKHGSKLCSQKCINKHNNKNLIDLKCFYCGKKFQRPSFTIPSNKRVYCSNKCGNNQYGLDNPTRYGGTWTRRRSETINRDDNKCLLCGRENDLQVHHFNKIKNFENPNDAHYDDNLGTFCKDCHEIVEKKEYKSLSQFLKDIV